VADPTAKDVQLELERVTRATEAFVKALAPITRLAKSLAVLEQREKELTRSVGQHAQAAQAAEEASAIRIATAHHQATEAESKTTHTCHGMLADAQTRVQEATAKADAITQRAAQVERDALNAVKILEVKQRELVLANQRAEGELATMQGAIAKARATMAQLLAV
jgi:hypothetical protein